MSIARRKNSPAKAVRALVLPAVAAVAAVVLVCFLSAVSGLGEGQALEDVRQLEQALRRACVTCYATEGVYPPDLEYLEEHYGLQIDRERYAVYYDIFAENLMPDITVLELE